MSVNPDRRRILGISPGDRSVGRRSVGHAIGSRRGSLGDLEPSRSIRRDDGTASRGVGTRPRGTESNSRHPPGIRRNGRLSGADRAGRAGDPGNVGERGKGPAVGRPRPPGARSGRAPRTSRPTRPGPRAARSGRGKGRSSGRGDRRDRPEGSIPTGMGPSASAAGPTSATRSSTTHPGSSGRTGTPWRARRHRTAPSPTPMPPRLRRWTRKRSPGRSPARIECSGCGRVGHARGSRGPSLRGWVVPMTPDQGDPP